MCCSSLFPVTAEEAVGVIKKMAGVALSACQRQLEKSSIVSMMGYLHEPSYYYI
jgi:hypothetical protein